MKDTLSTSPKQVALAICNDMDVLWSAVCGESRLAEYVVARRRIIRRLYDDGWPIATIARLLNRDHGTIHHHLKKGRR